MSDNYDDLITDAFDDFSVTNAPAVKAKGTQAVHTTVTHRRKTRFMTLSALGALLIAAPIAAFAANPRGNSSPHAAPSDISREEILTPAVMDRHCRPNQVHVSMLMTVNLDGDPALETVAFVGCTVTGSEQSLVLGFERDASGKIVSLGGLIPALDTEKVGGIEPRPAGGISAWVDWDQPDAKPGRPSTQVREYAWDGTKFTQVGGPTKFINPKADISITSTPLILGPVTDSKRSGVITVTVRNNGPETSSNIDIVLGRGATFANADGNLVGIGGLAPGAHQLLYFDVLVDASWAEDSSSIEVFAHGQDDVRNNNKATFSVTRY